MTGSHIDTQPTGGKFDGCFGVLAGVEVLRTLNDLNIETEAPLEVVVWTNEEGSRFVPVMMGSGVFCGAFSLETAYAARDTEGKSVKGELERDLEQLGFASLTHVRPGLIGGVMVGLVTAKALAMAARDAVSALHEPFVMEWRKRSWKPWDWELQSAAQPELASAS